MITMILCIVVMFAVSLAIRYFLFKKGKSASLWHNNYLLCAICFMGILFHDASYLAILLGDILADEAANMLGWK